MVVRRAVYLISGLAIGLFVLFIAMSGHARDIYVDVSYPYSDGDGSVEHPYTSIQQAIDNAEDGDSIYVFPGIYNETLLIDKEITLQGLSKENTTIWKNDSHRYTIEVIADFVTIEDFTIKAAKGCYVAAVYVKSDNVIIQGNFINVTGDIWAIYLDSSDGDTIGENVIRGGKGIYVTSSVNDAFTNNNITNCTVAGIKFFNSQNGIVYGNTLLYNQYGIYVQNCAGFNITNNTMKHNNVAGMNLYNVDNSTIYRNTFSQNPTGLNLNGIDCTVRNNTFDGNDIALVLHGNNNTILDNLFTNSILYAIDASSADCENNMIYKNRFLKNSNHAKGNGKNMWDNGEVGNYWDDYNDVDRNHDGIGDYPYNIQGGGIDRYPTGNFLKPPNKPEVISPKDGESNVGLSPVLQVKVTDPDSDKLSVYFYRASDNYLLAERHDIPNGGIASCTLHLPYNTVMAWYVVVNDSKLENVSDIWVFNTVPIPPTNDKPVADPGGPYQGFVGMPIQFDGSKSYDPDGEIKFYRWNFGDGSGEILAENPTHTYTKAGNYTVTLTVIDNNGTSNIAKTYAIVMEEEVNVAPISDPGGPYKGKANEEITFDGSSSYDPDGEIISYIWDFGDGSTAEGKIVTHTYKKVGTYMVTLTVVDNGGKVSMNSTSVTISEKKKTPDLDVPWIFACIILAVILINNIKRKK